MSAPVDPRWLGRRVSVRHLPSAAEHRADGGVHLVDALGDLVGLREDVAVVETAAGPVEVDRASVTAARLVEPTTPEVIALEGAAAGGWRAAETEWSPDGWLLRADAGRTHRANTALALRTPRRPLAEVVADVRGWYARRGLRLGITLPLPARSLLDGALEDSLGLVADVAEDVHVLAARLDRLRTDPAVLADLPPAPPVRLDTAPDAAWFAVHRDGSTADDPVMQQLLTRHDRAVFVSVRDGDDVLAVARGTVDAAPTGRDGRAGVVWLGVTGLEVVPAARGRGLARRLVDALWTWGAEQGAARSYVQVHSGNQPAIRLYLRAGYWHHHDYRYRFDPA